MPVQASGKGDLSPFHTRTNVGVDRAVCPLFSYSLPRTRSTSVVSCRAILSATSALAPRNFAPSLSCVVDQITSPSLFTSRTVASASCLRSWMSVESLSPTPTLKERRPLEVLLEEERVPVPTPVRRSTLSDDANWSV